MSLSRTVTATFFEHGASRVAALCGVCGFDHAGTERTVDLFRRMTSPWGDAPIRKRPSWPSDITDDHTPYELSLAIENGAPELRMLVEAQPTVPDAAAQWSAGVALGNVLERHCHAFLGRFHEIQDLFPVTNAAARFGMWHAVNVRAGAEPEFKVYLNPHAQGRARAVSTVGEALSRLGFSGAMASLPPICERHDELKYFSLDLLQSGEARVKVYLAHYRATAEDIEDALAVAGSHVPGEATAFCRAMAGNDGPYLDLPLQTCFSFTTGGGARPVAATVYFPVRSYVASDEVARSRILAYMDAEDRPLYGEVLRVFANRRLAAGTGMQTYASYRPQNGCRRVTVYLSPEAYRVAPCRGANGAPVSGVMPAPSLGGERRPSGLLRAVKSR
jgi:DMATS type aromatic prenyltransferase